MSAWLEEPESNPDYIEIRRAEFGCFDAVGWEGEEQLAPVQFITLSDALQYARARVPKSCIDIRN